MRITDHILSNGEYYAEITPKDVIVLHHTAGGHRPDWTIAAWEQDKNSTGGKLPVCTPYVIGGKSITDGNTDFNGHIFRAHDDKCWGHHLGVKAPQNLMLNKKAVGIEICNYGALTKTSAGYMNYVNKIVPDSDVVTLDRPFRGCIYWHAYTPEQIESLKELILDISNRYKINFRTGMIPILPMYADHNTAFGVSSDALNGNPGIWTHASFRPDKIDCAPQPILVDMLLSL